VRLLRQSRSNLLYLAALPITATTEAKHQIFDTLGGFRKTVRDLLFKIEIWNCISAVQPKQTGQRKAEWKGCGTQLRFLGS
jgi:hypothetical protein